MYAETDDQEKLFKGNYHRKRKGRPPSEWQTYIILEVEYSYILNGKSRKRKIKIIDIENGVPFAAVSNLTWTQRGMKLQVKK